MSIRLFLLAALAAFSVASAASAAPAGPAAHVLSASSTTKEWYLPGGTQQVVSAVVENDGADWITPQHPARITVGGRGVRTRTPAEITELAPGERARVEIGIAEAPSVVPGTEVPATVDAAVRGGSGSSLAVTLSLGVPAYHGTTQSLRAHEAPDWFDAAKFGIFIHWGVYSVPAFSRVGDYAEWYWHSIHTKGSVDYKHQLALYGPQSRYDQFIPQFRAQHFDPKAWVDLFHAAGARYFVLTSKHHEGFALFNTQTTDRNAVKLGPHRDLVKALFDAARTYQPTLHPALYYSLYEWYNPAYTGKPVPQWYSGKPVPYTGYKPLHDYVDDQVFPQLHEIIDQYHPAVIWCDGEWEKKAAYWHDAGVFAYYYNQARARKQGVAIDDRCATGDDKDNTSDFSTPEYKTYSTTVARKWEASRGMGYSYGYNAAEKPSDYKSAGDLIRMLVDMVSKNGNFLLDIGPKADGTIPAIMRERLLAIGDWLHVNGEAIYGSHYWWRTSQDGGLRFTIQPNRAFYIISLVKPASTIVVHEPVPIRDGDVVTMLGYAKPLLWHRDGTNLVIDVPATAAAAGSHAWTFKIRWH